MTQGANVHNTQKVFARHAICVIERQGTERNPEIQSNRSLLLYENALPGCARNQFMVWGPVKNTILNGTWPEY